MRAIDRQDIRAYPARLRPGPFHGGNTGFNCPPLRQRDDRPGTAASQARQEARAGSEERSAGTTDSVAGADASALGERRAVEVEGRPLIVDNYAAFPALGDLDGDGRMDLLLGDPRGFLKVYRNVGTPGRLCLTAPVRFGEFCDDERSPTGGSGANFRP
jgi:FG-GAP repeat